MGAFDTGPEFRNSVAGSCGSLHWKTVKRYITRSLTEAIATIALAETTNEAPLLP